MQETKNQIHLTIKELMEKKANRDGKIFTVWQLAKILKMPHSMILKLIHSDPSKRVMNPRIHTLSRIVNFFKKDGFDITIDDLLNGLFFNNGSVVVMDASPIAVKTEENKVLIARYFEEVWNQGKLEVLDEIIDANYVNHSPGLPHPAPGPEGLKPIVAAIRKAFPDLRFEIKNMVVTDEQVAIHCVMHGTHKADLFGMAPTGKTVEVNQMQIERIVNGKIVEHWRQSDDFGLMKQLGQM